MDYGQLSKQASELSKSDGISIDEAIKIVSSDNGLTKEASQRIVEEYNISSFLDRMQEGKHHEDFEVASPVVEPMASAESSSANDTQIQKTASEINSVTLDMFDLDTRKDSVNSRHFGSKVRSGETHTDINSDILYDLEKKAEDLSSTIEIEKTSREEEYNDAKASLSLSNYNSSLAYKIKGSPDMVKLAIAMSGEEDEMFISEVLESSSLLPLEISSSTITSETKERLHKLAFELAIDKGIIAVEYGSGLSKEAKVKIDDAVKPKVDGQAGKLPIKLIIGGVVGGLGIGVGKSILSNREKNVRADLMDKGQ